MGSEGNYTLTDISRMTGLHKNTIRNYIKKRGLKAEKVDLEGVVTWVIKEEDLYNSGIPRLNSRLGPESVDMTISRTEAEKHAVPDKYLEELVRLSRELTAANTELGVLQTRVPALEASQEEAERLKVENAVLKQALQEARANAKWTYRRRLQKRTNLPQSE